MLIGIKIFLLSIFLLLNIFYELTATFRFGRMFKECSKYTIALKVFTGSKYNNSVETY